MGASYGHGDNAVRAEVETVPAPAWCDSEERYMRDYAETDTCSSQAATKQTAYEAARKAEREHDELVQRRFTALDWARQNYGSSHCPAEILEMAAKFEGYLEHGAGERVISREEAMKRLFR